MALRLAGFCIIFLPLLHAYRYSPSLTRGSHKVRTPSRDSKLYISHFCLPEKQLLQVGDFPHPTTHQHQGRAWPDSKSWLRRMDPSDLQSSLSLLYTDLANTRSEVQLSAHVSTSQLFARNLHVASYRFWISTVGDTTQLQHKVLDWPQGEFSCYSPIVLRVRTIRRFMTEIS